MIALYVIDADDLYLIEYLFVLYEFCDGLLAHDLTDLIELLESLILLRAIKNTLLFFIFTRTGIVLCLAYARLVDAFHKYLFSLK